MKKYIAHFLVIIVFSFLLCSCDADSFIGIFTGGSAEKSENNKATEQEQTEAEKYDFAAILANVTSDYLVDAFEYDFDLDGTPEAYALTSENELNDTDVHSAGISLWFIKNGKATLLLDSGDYSVFPELWEFSDKTLFCIDEYTNGVPDSKVFFVSASGAYSYGDFGAKLVRESADGRDFYAWTDSEDSVYRVASSELSGENKKPYYLYFDGNFFCEYGGSLMGEDQLRTLVGADEILTAISDGGYTLGDIYYRDNGIININISKENGGIIMRENVTLALTDEKGVYLVPAGEAFTALESSPDAEISKEITDGKFEDVQAFSYGGYYYACAFPSLATYPEE